MPVSQTLKEQTRDYHAAAEDIMFAKKILEKTITRPEYTVLVEILLSFHNHYEAPVLRSTEAFFSGSMLSPAEKLQWLRKDAELLGIPAEATPGLFAPSAQEALGWLYVMEGATLGGQLIIRNLLKIPAICTSKAMNYYEGYGNETGMRWKYFTSRLDTAINSPADLAAVVSGAKNAYSKLLSTAGKVRGLVIQEM